MKKKLALLSLVTLVTIYGHSQNVFFPQFLDTIDHNIYTVLTDDVDGDLDDDIIVSYSERISTPFAGTNTYGNLGWFENLGNGFRPRQLLVELGLSWATTLFKDDFDGDNDHDLLMTTFSNNISSVSSIILLKNDGHDQFIGGADITGINGFNLGNPRVLPSDIDGDGDLDILASFQDRTSWPDSNKVVWYENSGDGLFLEMHLIYAEENSPLGSASNATSIADIDGDGSPDLLLYNALAGRVDSYLNDGLGNFSNPIPTSINSGNSIIAGADIDGDGDKDIVARTSSQTVWYQNNGSGTFGQASVVDSIRFYSFHISDMDNDNDLDIVAILVGNELVWFENDGVGNFEKHVVLEIDPADMASADFDSDGYQDLVVAVKYNDVFNYFGNLPSSSNIVSGNIYYDHDQNMIMDSDEHGLMNTTVSVQPDDVIVYSVTDGHYTFHGDSGTVYTVTLNEVDWWHLTTDSNTYQVFLPQDTVVHYDFGLYPDSLYRELDVHMTSLNTRCGEVADLYLNYINSGTALVQGVVEFISDNSTVITGYTPGGVFESGDTVRWTFGVLWPGENNRNHLSLQLPGVNSIGDTMVFTANVYVLDTAEITLDTFSAVFMQILTCAYDPNDKRVIPFGDGTEHHIDARTELTYTIRFQNTGNAVAYDVSITDTIDAHLDISTFKIVNRSHYLQAAFNNDSRTMQFDFPNIYLPDSTSDPSGSQGFVTYTIKPVVGLEGGTEIQNTAHIFFDSNPPITTNTVFHTILDTNGVTLILEETVGRLVISLFPNPFREQAFVEFYPPFPANCKLVIADLNGSIVRQYDEIHSTELSIDKGDLTAGMYIMQVIDDMNNAIGKSYKFVVY